MGRDGKGNLGYVPSLIRDVEWPIMVGGYRFDANQKILVQLEAEIPVVDEVDVLVAGAGVAGLGGAVGAGRTGAKTLLIEGQGFIGGVATASFMNLWTLPHQYVNGIAREIYDRLGQRKGAILGKAVPFHLEAFKTLSLELLEEASVELLFYTWAADVIKEGNRVVGLVVQNKSGRQAILAKCVVDTTGDAEVSARSKFLSLSLYHLFANIASPV